MKARQGRASPIELQVQRSPEVPETKILPVGISVVSSADFGVRGARVATTIAAPGGAVLSGCCQSEFLESAVRLWTPIPPNTQKLSRLKNDTRGEKRMTQQPPPVPQQPPPVRGRNNVFIVGCLVAPIAFIAACVLLIWMLFQFDFLQLLFFSSSGPRS